MNSFIRLDSVTKHYHTTLALDSVCLEFPKTGMIFIKGKSGCGKTTLLNILGGLDANSSGTVFCGGKDTRCFNTRKWDDYRNRLTGFIFQDYNLIDGLTVSQNIELVLDIQDELTNAHSKQKRIEETLSFVGLDGFASRKVIELSGGQRQRVAIARAIAKQSQVILADEPTGNLDSESGKTVLSLLKEVSKTRLVIIVTHDISSATTYGDRIITIADGKLIDDILIEERNHLYSISVSDTTNQKLFVISNKPLKIAKEKLSSWMIANEGKYECSIDVQKHHPSPQNDATTDENTSNIAVKSRRLPRFKKIHLAKLNLSQKKIRLAITAAMFSLTLSLLLVVSFVLMYDRTETISRYLASQNINEVYLYKNNSYENLFFETKSNNISKGEQHSKELSTLFPSFSVIPRMNISTLALENDSRYRYAFDIALALTDLPNILGRELTAGRFPQNGGEIAITDYVANIMLQDNEIVGKSVKVDNIFDSVVVGIIKTDYVEKQIAIKARLNDLNEFEQFDMYNIYQFAVAGIDLRNKMIEQSQSLTLPKSNFFISGMETLYMRSSVNYSPLSMLNSESLLAGRMPRNYNEILISQSFAQFNQLSETNFGELYKYEYLDIYDEFYGNTYIDSINLADYFPDGINIVGIYDYENIDYGYMPDALISNDKFYAISESYFTYYGLYDFALTTEGVDVGSLTKIADENGFRFNEPAIFKIYQFQGIIESLSSVIIIIFSVIMLITIFMLSTYISNNIKVNTKKIGVLKAIGVITQDIASIFLIEAVAISVISFVIASGFVVAFIYFVNAHYITQVAGHSFDYLYWNWKMVVPIFLIAIGLSIAAATLPLRSLAKKKPVEVIRADI